MRKTAMKYVWETINRWQKSESYYYEEEFLILVKTLKPEEKLYISVEFCKLPWTNKSVNILSLLHRSRVLTATEYLLSLNICQDIPKILKDLTINKIDLLANIIQNSIFNPHHSERLQCLLKEFFTILLKMLIEDSNAISTNYLKALKKSLPDDAFDVVREEHLHILFSTDKCTVLEAFQNLHSWEKIPQENSMLLNILKQLVDLNHTKSTDLLFNLAKTPNFEGWKFYSILLKCLVQNPTDERSTVIKKHLQDLFNTFLNKCDNCSCLQMLVASRSVHLKENLDAYKQWLKGTIGSMKYSTSADNFRKIIGTLNNMIPLEVDTVYLKAHASTVIPAPPLCNGLVIRYKKKCQNRLKELSEDLQTNLSEASIVIDSD